MTIHELKTWPTFFQAILDGHKTFEIRKDDRGFQKGDKLRLCEFDPNKLLGAYTGRSVEKFVTYVTGWKQKRGYVVLALGDTHPGL